MLNVKNISENLKKIFKKEREEKQTTYSEAVKNAGVPPKK